MKIEIKTDWLRANVNVKEGDHIKFLDAGSETTDPRGNAAYKFSVGVVRNGEIIEQKLFTPNRTNLQNTISVYGEDTTNWVQKEMYVNIIKVRNPSNNQSVPSVLLSPPNTNAEGKAINE